MQQDAGPYDYTTAGFDNFLSRSIDNNLQVTLNDAGPTSMSIPFDRTQISGSLGNVLKVGNILLDGINENITLSDNNNQRLLLGRQDGGF